MKSFKKIGLTILISGYIFLPIVNFLIPVANYIAGNAYLYKETDACESGLIDPKTRTYIYDSMLMQSPFTRGVNNWTVQTLIHFFGYSRNSYTGPLPDKNALRDGEGWQGMVLLNAKKIAFEYKNQIIEIDEKQFKTYPCYYLTCDQSREIEYKPFGNDLLLVRRVCKDYRLMGGNFTFVYYLSNSRIIQTLRRY